MKKGIFYLVLTFLLSSCAHGPETETKSPLNYLNGKNYEADSNVGGIPLSIQRKDRSTIITGQCFFHTPKNKTSASFDDYKYPVKFKKIALMKNGQIFKETATDALGNFTISASIPNGEYLLKSLDKNYEGQISINITSYQMDDIKLLLEKIE